ncbi:MAG TPA: HD domain-containing protein [Gemmatimonadaceae bacterium]|nr:HD domain-containing protein [Gemmatimonadaceae bacterium]
MTVTGYSDRINHALAFAAKHHDRQVRKGTRLPFRTHAANVAIILTRYGQDEETIIAGILHDFVEDSIRERFTREMLEQRLADKFGLAVIDTLLSVVERTQDDDGIELSHDERKDDYLARLGNASDRARWVCAASQVHEGSTILSELRRTIEPESVWSRFHWGKDGTIRWYRRVHERLAEVGFAGAIMSELGHVVTVLERHEASGASSARL